MEQDDYERDYAEYRRAYREEIRRQLEEDRKPRKGGSFLSFICQIIMIALAIAGGYFLFVLNFSVPEPAQGAQTSKPQQQQPPAMNRPGGSYTTSSGGSAPAVVAQPLPDCATVQDTRTACQRGEPSTPPVCQPAPAPVGVPECADGETTPAQPVPAYESTCQTAPGERPCWLPADQPWQPPADVPATPLVLLPEATSVPLVFSDSACAAWHPPLALPDECRKPTD